MKKFSMFLSLLLLVAGMGTASASTITFITLDFNHGMPTQMTGGNLESVQGYAGLGSGSNVFSGNFLRNDSGGYGDTPTSPVVPQTHTVLTLTGLPRTPALAWASCWPSSTLGTAPVPKSLKAFLTGRIISMSAWIT